MKTLYDLYPDLFDGFYHRFPNLVDLSKLVTTINDMDDAIGASRGCTLHWIKGKNIPSSSSERRASLYLRSRAKSQTTSFEFQDVIAAASTALNPQGTMFLVSVPEGSNVKAMMLLSMLRNINCEVVDF